MCLSIRRLSTHPREMGVPTVEKAPGGLKEPWLGIWRYALAYLRETSLWRPTLRPLLDAYVTALRLAHEHRLLAEAAPVETSKDTGLARMHDGFAHHIKYTSEARQLADMLGISPKTQKLLTIKADETPEEPDAFTQADQLAQRRQQKANA